MGHPGDWGGGRRRVGVGRRCADWRSAPRPGSGSRPNSKEALDQERAEIAKIQALIEELKKRNIEARETSRGVMVNLPSVNFQFDSAELTSDGRAVLTRLRASSSAGRRIGVSRLRATRAEKAPPKKRITKRLSERRADIVADALARDGVRIVKLVHVGWERARRLQATITKRVDGKFGGSR